MPETGIPFRRLVAPGILFNINGLHVQSESRLEPTRPREVALLDEERRRSTARPEDPVFSECLGELRCRVLAVALGLGVSPSLETVQ
jgi:hypothetical protein